MKFSHILLASLLAGCATAKDDPNAIVTSGRVIDTVVERPQETYVYTPPPANNSFSVAANAAANVTRNDTLRRPVCTYTIKTESGAILKHTDRQCSLSKNACVKIWASQKTSRPTIEAASTCAPADASAPKAD